MCAVRLPPVFIWNMLLFGFLLTSDHAPEINLPCDNYGRPSIERDRSARRTVAALDFDRSEKEEFLVRQSAEVGQELNPDQVVTAQRPVSEERLHSG